METHLNTSQKDKFLKTYALAVYAASHGIEAAEEYAQKEGMVFDKEVALRHLEAFLGEEIAAGQRALWDEKRSANLKRRIDGIIKKESAKLRTKHRIGHIANFAGVIKRTAQDIWDTAVDGVTQPQPNLAFRTANKGESLPNIAPSLDLEGYTLHIGLRLHLQAEAVMPNDKEAIVLFIDGEHISDFTFNRANDHVIELAVPVDDTYTVHAKEQEITLRLNPDIQEIAVIIGKDPCIEAVIE